MDDELTAYHESGHACVALLRGARVLRLTIEPEWDDGPQRFGDAQIEWSLLRHSPAQLCLWKVQTALGGPVAEMIYSGEPLHPGCVAEWQVDWRLAQAEAECVKREPQMRLRWLEEITRQLYHELRQDHIWATLASIADDLLAYETIYNVEWR